MKEITVTSRIDQNVQKVWECWTLPEHITRWNFATDEWHCPAAENDLKPGGHFSIRMEARDGSMGFDLEGTYTEVVPYKKIAYTLDDGRKVVVLFEEGSGTTGITEAFEPEDQNPEGMQQQGWQAILNNFKAYAETS